MKLRTVLALALVALGTLALAYRGFSYPGRSHSARLGPLEVAVKRDRRVEIPVWMGVATVGIGVVLLVFKRR
jgi:hypothetical protein